MIRVKICGVTSAEDAELAASLGATAVGMVFWSGSPRAVDVERAKLIALALPTFVTAVGVFVDQSVGRGVAAIADAVELDAIQLHGHENRQRLCGAGTPVDQVGRRPRSIRRRPRPTACRPARRCCSTHTTRVRRGGTGQTIDWTVAATIARAAAGDSVRRPDAGNRRRGRPCRSARTPSMCRRASNQRPAERIRRSCGRSLPHFARYERHPVAVRSAADPDARGYYGAYGGRFVPETLVAPIEELRSRLLPRPRGRRVPRRSWRSCCATMSGGRRRSTKHRRLSRSARRRAHHPQARGSRAYRRAQDQQRARPGAARRQHGEAADRGGDRCRPARRRDRDRLRAARARLSRLHGRRRHGAAGAECLPDAAARARSDRGQRRQPHAQGRHQRGDARLGHQCQRHVLPPRIRARPASVSADGARVPVGHRPRGAGAVSRAVRARCPTPIVACVGGGSNAMGIFDAFVADTVRRG